MEAIFFLQMKWFLVPVLLALSGFIQPSFADFEEMVSFLPDAASLPDTWQLGPVNKVDDLEIPSSEEKPDGVIRQFGIQDQGDSDSSLVVTLSLFEFSNQNASSKAHVEYREDVIQNNFETFGIQDNTDSKCFGVMREKDQDNEASSVACTADIFVIISTTEQKNGPVSENEQKLSTTKVAASFAEFVINRIEDSKNQIPDWIRNNAKWWNDGSIDDTTFIQGIQYLIKEGILVIPQEYKISEDQDITQIPSWVKTNAGWWSEGAISDEEFLKSIQFLIKSNIIVV